MKKTKHDYEKAFNSLVNQLEPIVEKIEDIKNKKPTKENLQIENSLLYKALAIYQNHINILDIIIDIPIGSGVKANPENEAILLNALEELISKIKKYPTETEWINWIDKPKYKPYQAAKKSTDTINGWSHAKLKKFLVEHKSELSRKINHTKITDMLVMKQIKNINN